MTNRVGHVDVAKGISIILVALYHNDLNYYAPDVMKSMGLFRMPLFFFLSGVFFSESVNARTFLLKKSDALLKPYFVTLLTLLLISALFGEGQLLSQLKGIFYGNGETIKWVPMWFLTHLFAVYCFAYFIFRFTGIRRKNVFYKFSTVATFMVIGALTVDVFWNIKIILPGKELTLPGLPFSLDLIFISASFFLMGAFLRNMVINFNPNVYFLYASILVFLAVMLLTDAHINLYNRIYANPLLATIGAICGIYFLICASFYINKTTILRFVFLTFGQASLFILIFHFPLQALTFGYLGKSVSIDAGLWVAVTAFMVSIVAPVLIKIAVTKNEVLSFLYLPVKSSKRLPIDAATQRD